MAIDAFALAPDGKLVMSFTQPAGVPGIVGTVDDSDLVKFNATSLGATTAGTFQRYFDGSDVGLTTDAEDIDALDRDDPSRFGGTGEAFESLLHRLDAGILVPVLAQEAPGSIDVMQAFAMNAKIAGVRNRLLDALESKKPLRRFKEVLDAAGLRTSWREFRRGVIASMLVDLLDDYQIPYTPYTGDLPRQS